MKSSIPKIWKVFFLIGLFLFISLMALPFIISGPERKPIEKIENAALLKYDSLGYSKLSIQEKETILNMVIDNKEPFKDMHYLIYSNVKNIIEKSVKYPKTIQYSESDGSFTDSEFYISKYDITNKNYENGTFDIIKNFKAENKLGMKVNSTAYFKIKFDGKPTILEFNIN